VIGRNFQCFSSLSDFLISLSEKQQLTMSVIDKICPWQLDTSDIRTVIESCN
jgi:hypothetical protein